MCLISPLFEFSFQSFDPLFRHVVIVKYVPLPRNREGAFQHSRRPAGESGHSLSSTYEANLYSVVPEIVSKSAQRGAVGRPDQNGR